MICRAPRDFSYGRLSRRLPGAMALAAALVLAACGRGQLDYPYSVASARSGQQRFAPTLLVDDVVDRRDDVAIDERLRDDPNTTLTTILRREIASTGAFSQVRRAGIGASSGYLSVGRDPAWRARWSLRAELLTLEWRMPYYWAKKIGGGVAGMALGWVGGVGSFVAPVAVNGECRMRIVVHDLDGGEALLDEVYIGSYEGSEYLGKTDWPSSRSAVVARAIEDMMGKLKIDLVHMARLRAEGVATEMRRPTAEEAGEEGPPRRRARQEWLPLGIPAWAAGCRASSAGHRRNVRRFVGAIGRWARRIFACAGAAIAIDACPASAQPQSPFVLELPVACSMADTCSIQKYFDHDPGSGRMDYACGRLSNDGEAGTDFRVPDYPTMRRGVAVLAAAGGVVKAVRDGMPDVSVREAGKDAIARREAGNGVVLDHGRGWETQYSHLLRGSVAVKPGEQVAVGARLGFIGLSGNTEFPHVEFSVRRNGQPVDPFVGPKPTFKCGDPRSPLWSAEAERQLAYRPSGLLIAGFSTGRPEASAARNGAYAVTDLPADAPALVLWTEIYGAMAGDTQRFRILGPANQVLLESEERIDRSNIDLFAFAGLRRPAAGWAPGAYVGEYLNLREGATVIRAERTVTIAPR